MIFYIFLGIFALSMLIFVHEAGHFFAGKAFGVKVNEFMLGLPSPKLIKFQRGETTYGITVLPFGGYVKFAGMDPTEKLTPEEEKRGFDGQPVWRRLLILVSGPAANLLFATIVFSAVFMYGVPAPTTTVGQVLKAEPATKVGIKIGDTIVRIGAQPINSWEQMVGILHGAPGDKVTIIARRAGHTVTFTPTLANRAGKGFLGIGPKMTDRGFGFLESIWLGMKTTALLVVAVIGFLIELPQRVGLLRETRGPLGLVQESAKAARNGFRDFIWLIGAFSVSLGVFNFLPIPPLDGGKFLLATVEGVTRRKLNKNIVIGISAVGAVLLISLMVYVVVADIGRLLPGAAGG